MLYCKHVFSLWHNLFINNLCTFLEASADIKLLKLRKIFINRVIHKTYIQVGEKGTRAGAATVVQINKTSLERPDESKQVYLDRPFVYMILDCENNLPFFIGTMTGLK